MNLTEIFNALEDSFVPHHQNTFVLYTAILFALWSIGWTVRDAVELDPRRSGVASTKGVLE